MLNAIEQSGALKMPPGQKLPDQIIAAVRRWIELGAPWTEIDEAPTVSKIRSPDDVWAFQPLSKISVAAGMRSPIDWFITQKLEKNKIKPAPAADRRTLIRRATFDLWGLPPSPEDVDSFVRDPLPDPEAWRKLVERLLASIVRRRSPKTFGTLARLISSIRTRNSDSGSAIASLITSRINPSLLTKEPFASS